MMALHLEDPAYFARLALVESEHWWSAGMWRITSGWLDNALHGRSKLVALDIGCGSGGTMRMLSVRTEIDRVIGIDPSGAALSHVEVGAVLQGSALALPIGPNSVDVLTCLDVLQHLPPGGDYVAFREIARVLRPGGIAVVRTNGPGLWPDRMSIDQPYRLATLTQLAAAASLALRRSTYANCLPSILTEMIGRIRPTLKAHGHPQGRGLRIRPVGPARNRIMSWITAIESMAITRLNLRLPVGHSAMLLVQKPGGGTP